MRYRFTNVPIYAHCINYVRRNEIIYVQISRLSEDLCKHTQYQVSGDLLACDHSHRYRSREIKLLRICVREPLSRVVYVSSWHEDFHILPPPPKLCHQNQNSYLIDKNRHFSTYVLYSMTVSPAVIIYLYYTSNWSGRVASPLFIHDGQIIIACKICTSTHFNGAHSGLPFITLPSALQSVVHNIIIYWSSDDAADRSDLRRKRFVV